MDTTITLILKKRRSLEQALADMRAKFQLEPSPGLARMIGQLDVEVGERRSSRGDALLQQLRRAGLGKGGFLLPVEIRARHKDGETGCSAFELNCC